MNVLKSKFAADFSGFLELKEAFGNQRESIWPLFKRFDDFCINNYPEKNVLERRLVLDWLSFEGESSNTKSKACVIRQFGKYLSAIGKPSYILPDNFVHKNTGFSPYIPSNNELSAFFKAVDSLNPYHENLRRHIIAPVLFRLLYTCGLRPGEGRLLKTSDVNLQNGEIIIRNSKQKKERIVVMSDDMLGFCGKYDAERQRFESNNEYFFPAFGNAPYSAPNLISLFHICWKKANPSVPEECLPPFRPYDLRHCFASVAIHRWLDEKRDVEGMLPYLRAYMGHENFCSTYYYLHLLPEHLARSGGIDLSAFEELVPEVES